MIRGKNPTVINLSCQKLMMGRFNFEVNRTFFKENLTNLMIRTLEVLEIRKKTLYDWKNLIRSSQKFRKPSILNKCDSQLIIIINLLSIIFLNFNASSDLSHPDLSQKSIYIWTIEYIVRMKFFTYPICHISPDLFRVFWPWKCDKSEDALYFRFDSRKVFFELVTGKIQANKH